MGFKRLSVIVIGLLMSFNVFAQEIRTIPKVLIHVDAKYDKIFMELNQEFIDCGISVLPLRNINYIVVVPYLPNVWAIVTPDRTGILIDDNIPEYLPLFKKFVLLHEIGHFYDGIGHTEDGPMVRRAGTTITVEDVIRNYYKYEKEYLNYLYNKQNVE